MDYHQSIAAVCAATCAQVVAVLSHTLSTHGYRLECSFDLHSARYAAASDHDQYLILLAYDQAGPTPPIVITLHELAGLTQLSAAMVQPDDPFALLLQAACEEIETDSA